MPITPTLNQTTHRRCVSASQWKLAEGNPAVRDALCCCHRTVPTSCRHGAGGMWELRRYALWAGMWAGMVRPSMQRIFGWERGNGGLQPPRCCSLGASYAGRGVHLLNCQPTRACQPAPRLPPAGPPRARWRPQALGLSAVQRVIQCSMPWSGLTRRRAL